MTTAIEPQRFRIEKLGHKQYKLHEIGTDFVLMVRARAEQAKLFAKTIDGTCTGTLDSHQWSFELA